MRYLLCCALHLKVVRRKIGAQFRIFLSTATRRSAICYNRHFVSIIRLSRPPHSPLHLPDTNASACALQGGSKILRVGIKHSRSSVAITYINILSSIKVFYLPTDAQQSCSERILKFTLKQLLHVSVQSPSSGSVLFELAKVIVIKIIS